MITGTSGLLLACHLNLYAHDETTEWTMLLEYDQIK
jgi:hypothetical protein